MARLVAITGANGFIGTHVMRAARAAGWDVAGIVRSEAGRRAVVDAGGRPWLVPGLEPEALAPALAGAAGVVHLANIGSERGGATYEAVNVGGMRAFVAAARAAGVARVVDFSGLGVAQYGIKPYCTNPYFLSKLTAEVELYRSGLEAVVFRPSYVLGPGGELVSGLREELASGSVEQIGDGGYRMQPISVRDAAALVLAALEVPLSRPRVFDLVGPEVISYRAFIERAARLLGRSERYQVREIAVEEAYRQAAAGGYRGMAPDVLDCLLCDEVSDPRPLEALLGRFLTPLDEILSWTLRVDGRPPR
jgi:NADH dehydrogenase